MKIKKNDRVRVISGEYREKEGKVLTVFPKKKTLIIEGINFQKRHTRARSAEQPGGILQKEGPIHSSNVMLICPRCSSPTKLSIERTKTTRTRKCRKCGEMIE